MTIKFHIYKNLQSQLTTYVIQNHQQNNLLKSQLLAFKLKLTIFEIPLISRGNLFQRSAYDPHIVLKRHNVISIRLPSFITMWLVYPRKSALKYEGALLLIILCTICYLICSSLLSIGNQSRHLKWETSTCVKRLNPETNLINLFSRFL